MKLIILRHSETEENKAGIIQGQTHGQLSELGKQQAEIVAERLKHEKIDKIYVSDLERTVHTAEPVIQYHPEAEVIYTKELRERNFGTLEGTKSNPEMTNKLRDELGQKFIYYKPGGGESIHELTIRAENFLKKVIKQDKGKTILFVTHGGIVISLLFYLLKIPKEEQVKEFRNYHPKNTAISIFTIKDDGNHEAHLINCAKHLEE